MSDRRIKHTPCGANDRDKRANECDSVCVCAESRCACVCVCKK